jgi:hypothetical protein
LCFDPVKVPDLNQDPCGFFGGGIQGFKKASPDMSPTSGQDYGLTLFFAATGEAIIGAITITLNSPCKLDGDQVFQATRCSSGVPLVDHIASRLMRHPQIALACFSIARIEVSDRCLIDLKVGTAHHLSFYFNVNGLEPFTD